MCVAGDGGKECLCTDVFVLRIWGGRGLKAKVWRVEGGGELTGGKTGLFGLLF